MKFVTVRKDTPMGVFRAVLVRVNQRLAFSLENQGGEQFALRASLRGERKRDAAIVVGFPVNWRPQFHRRNGGFWLAWLLFAISANSELQRRRDAAKEER